MASQSFADRIGKTRLVEIGSLSKATGCRILGKAEFENPGGSIKDRAALSMLTAAEAGGLLHPRHDEGAAQDMVIEATAANTGIALAHLAKERGYRCVFYAPPTTSSEKVQALEELGAEVRVCEKAAIGEPLHFQSQARARAAQEAGHSLWTNQFDNLSNMDAHFRTTGPEIWMDTEGKIDAFVCASGTGGTIAGVSRYLHSQKSDIQCYLIDIPGSAVTVDRTLKQPRSKTAEEKEQSTAKLTGLGRGTATVLEGIGSGRLYANLASASVDHCISITDEAAISMLYYVRQFDALFLGSSSGANLLGAYLVAKLLGPGNTIVTVLCDSGDKYLSKIYNAEFLSASGMTDIRTTHTSANDLSFADECIRLNETTH